MKSLLQYINWNKPVQTLQEIEISYKSNIKPSDRIKIKSASEVYKALMSVWNQNTIELNESFYILYLDRANHILGWVQHSIGGISGTLADIRLILATALKARASSIILAHNHPSGNLYPSHADRQLTKKIGEGAKLLDLTLLDHLIVISEGHYSFADEGLL